MVNFKRKHITLISTYLRNNLEGVLGAVVLASALIDVMLQVITRILPVQAFPWTVELGQILLGTMIWLGIGDGVIRSEHVILDFFVKKIPLEWQKVFAVLDHLSFIIFLAILAGFTVMLMQDYLRLDSRTTVMRLNLYWVRLPIVLGCLMAIIRLSVKIVLIIKGDEPPFLIQDEDH